MPDKPRLAPPEYKGPGKPVETKKPSEMKHVREGNFCGQCRHLVEGAKGREALQKQGFWDKLFHGQGKHSIKPWMVGDPSMYSICEERNAAVHYYSTCPKWKSKDTFVRIILGKNK